MSQRYRSTRRSTSADYVVPFLIIVSIGVILVLLFNLWKAVFVPKNADGAYIHVIEGSVEMRDWNTDDFFDITADVLMTPGDELKTSSDAQVIVEFFDGTVMRADGGTNFVLNEIENTDRSKAIHLLLVDGKLWFNKVYKDSGGTMVNIKTDSILVKSGSENVFEVENEFDDVVRVMFGADVDVDVFAEDGKKVVETEKIGVGQEIVFSSAALSKYWSYLSPSVLSAVADEFKTSEWFIWNDGEDKNPTEFVKVEGSDGEFKRVEPEVLAEEEEVLLDEEGNPIEKEVVEGEVVSEGMVVEGEDPAEDMVVEDEKVTEEKPLELGDLSTPKILSVSGKTETNEGGFYVEGTRLATLKGSVSGAEKVVVNGFTLSKFKPGDTEWFYFANADFSLMRKGENFYEVVAYGKGGAESEKLIVKVLHDPAVVEPVAPAVAEDTSGIIAQ